MKSRQPHDKMLKLGLCLFICLNFATAVDETTSLYNTTTSSKTAASTELQTSTSITVTDLPKYIFKLFASINDSKVPSYLTNLIQNNASTSNITSDDILNLYSLKNISLVSFEEVLQALNISASAVLSKVGFEGFMDDLGLDFSKIYHDTVENLHINSSEQKTFLESLGVDLIKVAGILVFGGDLYQEVNKTNLTEKIFLSAVNDINRTTQQFFEVILTNVVNGIIKKTPEDILDILKNYGIESNKLSMLWSIVNVDPNKPHQISAFENVFQDITSKINAYLPLGILTGENQITTNKAVAVLFQDQPIKITAQHVGNNSIWNVSNITNATLNEFMLLALDNLQISNESYALLASSKTDLLDCVFFSIDSSTDPLYETVPITHNNGDILMFNSTIFKSFVPVGSPLICANGVYGLAKHVSSGLVTLNSFPIQDVTTVNTDSTVPSTNSSSTNSASTPSSSGASSSSEVLGNFLLVIVATCLYQNYIYYKSVNTDL